MISNKIVFVAYNNLIGSDNLRINNIANILKNKMDIIILLQCYENTFTIRNELFDILREYEKCIFIWVWSINIETIKLTKSNNNINIFDLVDKYIYEIYLYKR